MLTQVPMSDPIWDTVSDVLQKSWPNMCICWIEKNENNALMESYVIRKERMIAMRGESNVKEMTLFHGTKEASVDAICQNGFQVSMNRVSAYGKGTYFSPSAQMSNGYTDKSKNTEMSYMFVCKVLFGKCKVGTSNETIDTILYDNTVNTLKNPTIITTPYDDGAYPEYIVAYYKNAV